MQPGFHTRDVITQVLAVHQTATPACARTVNDKHKFDCWLHQSIPQIEQFSTDARPRCNPDARSSPAMHMNDERANGMASLRLGIRSNCLVTYSSFDECLQNFNRTMTFNLGLRRRKHLHFSAKIFQDAVENTQLGSLHRNQECIQALHGNNVHGATSELMSYGVHRMMSKIG